MENRKLIMAQRQWTLKQRKEQSKKIKQWEPWHYSTGAKTVEGKAKSAHNAFKGGFRQELKELRQVLREYKEKLDEI